jgi:hypothetical protein
MTAQHAQGKKRARKGEAALTLPREYWTTLSRPLTCSVGDHGRRRAVTVLD